MKKFQIWDRYRHNNQEASDRGGMLIPEDEIKEVVILNDTTYYLVEGMSTDIPDSLKNEVADIDIEDDDDLAEFLNSNGIEYDSIDYADDYELVRSVVVYDRDEKTYSDMADMYTEQSYKWHDGSNWKTEFAGNDTTVTEVTTEDEKFKDLDTWDGNNWNTGGQNFYHEYVYRILEVDGKPVEDMFLLCEWSQWQGDHETARILTRAELEDHIKALQEAC